MREFGFHCGATYRLIAKKVIGMSLVAILDFVMKFPQYHYRDAFNDTPSPTNDIGYSTNLYITSFRFKINRGFMAATLVF